jgi:hypothetical protein
MSVPQYVGWSKHSIKNKRECYTEWCRAYLNHFTLLLYNCLLHKEWCNFICKKHLNQSHITSKASQSCCHICNCWLTENISYTVLGTFISHPHTQVHIPCSNISLFTDVVCKSYESYCMAATLLSYNLQKVALIIAAYYLKI